MADDPTPSPTLAPGHPLLRADRRVMTTRPALRAPRRIAPRATAPVAAAPLVTTSRPAPPPAEAAWPGHADRFPAPAAGPTHPGALRRHHRSG